MADAELNDSHQGSHQGSTYRRIELISGEAKRRLWTAEEKAGILSESFRPGAKVAEVARRHAAAKIHWPRAYQDPQPWPRRKIKDHGLRPR